MSMVWLDPAATGNRTHKSSWSVLGPPYRRLLRSAGATEDLFVTRRLNQEPPPRIPTGSLLCDANALGPIEQHVWRSTITPWGSRVGAPDGSVYEKLIETSDITYQTDLNIFLSEELWQEKIKS